MARSVGMLDPETFHSVMGTAAVVLENHAAGLDGLEADLDPVTGDATGPRGALGAGSDLAATLASAVAASAHCHDFSSMGAAMCDAARAAAHGRSGRALARYLDGLAEVIANADRIDANRFALGLEAAAERLAPADDGSHPGGFTAVANAAADEALKSVDRGLDLAGTVIAAAEAGVEELERGPQLDSRLAERGTVDGSAAGLLLVLDVFASVLTDEPLPEPPVESGEATDPVHDGNRRGEADRHAATAPSAALRYEVSCEVLPDLEGVEPAADLEAELASAADLEVFEAGGPRWRVSLVTSTPGRSVEVLAAAGRLRELHIGLRSGSVASDPLPTP